MQFVYLFARCSTLNAGSKALHGALLLSHRDILTLKDRDHKQKFCSLIATCSDFTGMVFTSNTTKRMVIFKISTGQTAFCHLLYVTSPKMVCNGHWQGNKTREHVLQYTCVKSNGNARNRSFFNVYLEFAYNTYVLYLSYLVNSVK